LENGNPTSSLGLCRHGGRSGWILPSKFCARMVLRD
jgi:hypothetical protein